MTRLETVPKWDGSEIVITLNQLVKHDPLKSHLRIFPEILLRTPHTPNSSKLWFDIYSNRRIVNMYLEIDEEKIS
jgi:hypothetical protein